MSNIYVYSQNNSYGRYEGPAKDVYVEANSADEANYIARQKLGLYFDTNYLVDCDCCGCRWYEVDEYDYHKLPPGESPNLRNTVFLPLGGQPIYYVDGNICTNSDVAKDIEGRW